MKDKQQILSLFESNGGLLRRLGVMRIGLFGSVARGDAKRNSDVDVLVEFTRAGHTFDNFNRLCDFLETNIGTNYDLITPESLKPRVRQKVASEVQYAAFA
jgi:predicted nucleotidyltransferase